MHWICGARRASAAMCHRGLLIRSTWNGIWSRRDFRDGALIFGTVAAVYAGAIRYDLPPKFLQLANENAAWVVDDIVFLFLVVSVAFSIYSNRRAKDLSREM